MKFFSLIDKESVHLAPEKKVIRAKEFSSLKRAEEIVKRAQEEEIIHREKVAKESEELKEMAKKEGFQEGLKQFSNHIRYFEDEVKKVKGEVQKAIVPLALAAIKKIIGKELEIHPETVSDIISTALKSVSHHRRVAIYVNPADLEMAEKGRPQFKALFEHLESLTIIPRDDVTSGGCIIETEAGILNAQLENQLDALEAAFRTFFENMRFGVK